MQVFLLLWPPKVTWLLSPKMVSVSPSRTRTRPCGPAAALATTDAAALVRTWLQPTASIMDNFPQLSEHTRKFLFPGRHSISWIESTVSPFTSIPGAPYLPSATSKSAHFLTASISIDVWLAMVGQAKVKLESVERRHKQSFMVERQWCE